MRHALGVILLFVLGSAQAAPVTIDFENNSYTTVGNDVFSKGFKFSGATAGPSNFEYASVGTGAGPNHSFGVGDSGGDICNSGGCNFAGVSFRRDDGGAFALYSLDYELEGIDSSLRGLTMDNQTVSISTPFGTGGWLNLKSVSLDASTPDYFPYTSDVGVNVDNIVVSAVPIPAAVWLFGSGLGLLVWFARRQSA